MTRPVIAVIGGTGRQGRGLIRALLADPKRRFEIRVVAPPPDDTAALGAALRGAHGAFWAAAAPAQGAPEREPDRARALAEAAARERVAHVVWSTFEPTRAFVERGVPATLVVGSFDWDDLVRVGLDPSADDEGVLALRLPLQASANLPGIAGADLGACAFTIFANYEEATGKTVGVAAEYTTGVRMAQALSTALGRHVVHEPVTPEQLAARDVPGAAHLARTFAQLRDGEEAFCAARSVACTRELHAGVRDFAAWLAGERERLVTMLAEPVR